MSSADSPKIICSNPDCRIAETGKCVEGVDTGKCPYFGHAPEEAAQTHDEVGDAVPLPPGGTLDIAGASKLLRAGETRVIAVIGPSDSGKTSLIASLYDLFQSGPLAGVEFSGSLSLHEFEHICHDARAASRRNEPHSSRTPRGEVRFYHLNVAGGAAGSGLTLTIGDRAGEEYRSAVDDTSVVPGFLEIARADSLTLLIDGERLLDAGKRHNLRSETELIVQAVIEGGVIATRPRLAILLTKLDLVQESDYRNRAEMDFARLVASLERQHGNSFSNIQHFQVAASPKTTLIERGAGVAELLIFWLGGKLLSKETAHPVSPPAARVFGRFCDS